MIVAHALVTGDGEMTTFTFHIASRQVQNYVFLCIFFRSLSQIVQLRRQN